MPVDRGDLRDSRDMRDLRERDILVAPSEFAYVQDLTKGDIVLYVGPTKISLSNTERLVEFYNDRFVPVRGEDGRQGVYPFISASSAQYIILENPPKDPAVRPVKGANYAVELLNGRKVVVPGPSTFPLWPGQKAQVIGGHELREDQYLVARVYDQVEGDSSPIGTEKIIRGSEQSFYIPRTGLEVIPEEKGFVRSAVTLLDGQYCILLAPNGKRKYTRGPAVVFPEPMEEFVRAQNSRVFKAWHLRKNMGLHLRVVKDFESNGDEVPAGSYKAGQELFIKDREGFFYPSETLETIGEVLAVPIAEKEGIYVREVESGRITTEVGPRNYLPDPTKVEVIKRTLSPERARLYGLNSAEGSPRAISIYIPPSCAVLVTAKDRREVVRGPTTRILSYDEDLEILHLSTGRPKTEENLLATCFLMTEGNKVSDIVRVKTRDHVELDVTLSYRVNLVAKTEKDAEKWFNVNNYVALLCDHLGSIVRAAVRSSSIDAFHSNSAEVIRAAILGEKKGEEKRAGRHFDENNLWVYDVEVLDVRIQDAEVKALLSHAQRTAIDFEVTKRQEQMRLDNEKLKQEVERQILEARVLTTQKAIELEGVNLDLALAKTRVGVELDQLDKVGRARNQAESMEILAQAQHAAESRKADLEKAALESRVTAFKDQMGAMAPELVSTLKVLGDQQLAGELTRSLSPLAILGGGSVAEVAERLLKGMPVGVTLTEGALKAVSGLGKDPSKK